MDTFLLCDLRCWTVGPIVDFGPMWVWFGFELRLVGFMALDFWIWVRVWGSGLQSQGEVGSWMGVRVERA